MKTLMAAVAALSFAGWAGQAQAAGTLEIRFCPGNAVRTYPLASQQNIQGLVLQNAVVINRGTLPVDLKTIELQLLSGGMVMDTRVFAGEALVKLAKAGPAVQGGGMLEAAPFQFCGDKMIEPGITLAGPVLKPNEALLMMYQPMAYRGGRDALRVQATGEAGGKPVAGTATVPVLSGETKNSYIFPLRGTWYVGVGPTFHTGHRWAVPEEFAFDIAKIGETGLSHRGDGTKFTDYYAYGAEVIATAAGRVVAVADGMKEDASAMRRPDETVDGYFKRLLEDQAKRMAEGLKGIPGNYVMIDHGNGEYSMSAHLLPGSVRVHVGDVVAQGQTIGKLGSSGNSTEPHLHYQLCDAADPVMCAGIPVQFANIEIPWADGTRPLQSGDVIVTK